ncbi:Hsp33 family molecular chaperone HslO [Alteromonas facilis]|uniref:Hsp33 family molecular chaperone HslO n=1 Tax=Alteromonas facilis TaxID=2048004 RepID=UPI000C28C918|nr:Hsp33 family molecular chaperone HslO [Alteromonas facilis]
MNNDQLQRYIFPDASVRGELVQLEKSYADLLASHAYPDAIKRLLGEMLSAATLLTATLKFKGEISLQIQSEGLVKYAVVDATHQQQVRGIARWDESVEQWPERFQELFTKGVMAITITPEKGERYQGLVGLDQDSLAECIQGYFIQSEQLPTRVVLFTDTAKDNVKAAGMLLQVLPQSSDATNVLDHAEFNDLAVLTDTMTSEEILSLDARTLLHRLYHEYDVELYAPHPVTFSCTCSKERSAQALKNIEKAELLSIIEEQGVITMDCQYCHAKYEFDSMDVESIHAGFANVPPQSNTQ